MVLYICLLLEILNIVESHSQNLLFIFEKLQIFDVLSHVQSSDGSEFAHFGLVSPPPPPKTAVSSLVYVIPSILCRM